MILCRHKGNKHNVFVMSHLFHKRFQALWPKIPPWYEMLLPGILCCYSQHKSTKTRKRLEQSHLHMKQFTCCRLRKGAQLLFLMKRHDYKNNWSKFGRSSVQGCLHLWTSSSKCPTQAILKSKVQGPKSKCKQANMTLIIYQYLWSPKEPVFIIGIFHKGSWTIQWELIYGCLLKTLTKSLPLKEYF